jgi:hypothetical protein
MKDIVMFILVISFVVMSLMTFDYFTKKKACQKWMIETDRELKFVSDFPFYWDCLIKTDSGWISGSHLYQEETPNIQIGR